MICVPPTSGVEVVTPAISCPTANGSLPVGIVSSTSRFMTDCDTEPRTSTSGETPVTVTASSIVPTAISAFTVEVNDTGSMMPSRRTCLNPVSVKVTVYSPGRRSTIRYWPVPSVVAARVPSMRDGLDTSTVTPGSTAPDGSLTIPAIALCANEAVAAPNPTRVSRSTLNVRVIVSSSNGRNHVTSFGWEPRANAISGAPSASRTRHALFYLQTVAVDVLLNAVVEVPGCDVTTMLSCAPFAS